MATTPKDSANWTCTYDGSINVIGSSGSASMKVIVNDDKAASQYSSGTISGSSQAWPPADGTVLASAGDATTGFMLTWNKTAGKGSLVVNYPGHSWPAQPITVGTVYPMAEA